MIARFTRRVLRACRMLWNAVGLVLLVALSLELAYRLQAAIRQDVASGGDQLEALSPYAGQKWYHVLSALRLEEADRTIWSPYVEVALVPFHSEYLNIDADRHRRTIQRGA